MDCGVCDVDEGVFGSDLGFGDWGKMDFDSADIAEQIALKAVSLTHVRYAKGDQLGHALSWASLLPVFIGLGGFMSHFIFRRELQAMFFGLGLCVSEVINQVRWFVGSFILPSTFFSLHWLMRGCAVLNVWSTRLGLTWMIPATCYYTSFGPLSNLGRGKWGCT